LPTTGGSTGIVLLIAAGLLLGGGVALFATRRPRATR
jgi:LPXTG-motif cell wall-anchored protein